MASDRAWSCRVQARSVGAAVAWQLASQRGGWAAFRSHVDQSGDRRARRKEPNRIAELHALMGVIGEQAALSWGFEQDAQRFDATKSRALIYDDATDSVGASRIPACHMSCTDEVFGRQGPCSFHAASPAVRRRAMPWSGCGCVVPVSDDAPVR